VKLSLNYRCVNERILFFAVGIKGEINHTISGCFCLILMLVGLFFYVLKDEICGE